MTRRKCKGGSEAYAKEKRLRRQTQFKLPGFRRLPNGKMEANPVTSAFVNNFMSRSHSIHGQSLEVIPPSIANILHIRNEQLTDEQRSSLDSAYNTARDVQRCGVYIWVHQDFAEKVYVGMYCGRESSLFARTSKHIKAANSSSKRQGARHTQWGPPKDDTPFQLYAHMVRCGLDDLVTGSNSQSLSNSY